MDISFRNDSLNKLVDAVRESGRSMRGEFAAAVNRATRGTKVPISREIRKELVIKASAMKDQIRVTRKATKQSLMGVVRLDKSERISLKHFGARQTKAGVSYRISKSKGRQVAAGAFQGPKLGVMFAKFKGVVFARIGKAKLPIRKLMGPSPWGVFTRRKMQKPIVADAQQRLEKEIARRIQFNIFKANQLKAS